MAAYNDTTEQALRANATELGSKAAATRIQRQMQNSVTVPFILPPGFSHVAERRYGFSIVSSDKKTLTSDHPFMALDREVVRDIFENNVKIRKTSLKTLCIGSSMYEISSYFGNVNVSFHVHGSEGKDTTRLVLPLLEAVFESFGKYVNDVDGVELRGRYSKRLSLELGDLQALFSAYELATVGKVGRLHLGDTPSGFQAIVAHDCAYNKSEEEWFQEFDNTGAFVAHVTGFFPPDLVFPDVMPSTEYVYTREKLTEPHQEKALKGFFFRLAKLYLKFKFGAIVEFTIFCAEIYEFMIRDSFTIAELGDFCFKVLLQAKYGKLVRWSHDIVRILLASYESHLSDRVSVTFRNGYSNGYEHNWEDWSLLMRKPVLTSPGRNYVLEVECKQTAGAHRWFTISRSYSHHPVVRTLSVPKSQETVLILDLEKTFATAITTPTYFPVLKTEFDTTINFLSGQLDSTLTFEAVQTLINRASGGVKIATTEVTPVWTMLDDVKWKFAVAVTLEAHRRHKRANDLLKSHKKQLEGYNRLQLLNSLRSLASSITGLGQAEGSLLTTLAWLFSYGSSVEIVRPVCTSQFQRWSPTEAQTSRIIGEDIAIVQDFAYHREDVGQVFACETLQLLQPVGAQSPRCLHGNGEKPKKTKITVSQEKLDNLRSSIRTQREKAPADLVKVLDEFKDAIPKNEFELELELNLLVGGPGVGKSHAARNLLTNIESAGLKTCVYAPFNKLGPDYPAESRNGQIPFTFRTTHQLHKLKGIHTVLVDEYTSLEETTLLVSLYLCNASSLWLAGDEEQTGVMAHEGQRIFRDGSVFSLDGFLKHVLPVNFRNSQYIVALCNTHNNSGMYANSNVRGAPHMLPMDELTKRTDHVIMTFTNLTGALCGLTEENSVRANQGGTMTHVAVPVQERDIGLIKDPALFLVAISRAKAVGSLTFYVDEGPARTLLRDKLRLDDADFQRDVTKLARPNLDELYGETVKKNSESALTGLATLFHDAGLIQTEEQVCVEQHEEEKETTIGSYMTELITKCARPVADALCGICGSGYLDGICTACSTDGTATETFVTIETGLKKVLDFTSEGDCFALAATTSCHAEALKLEDLAWYPDWKALEGLGLGEGVTFPRFRRALKERGLDFLIEVVDGAGLLLEYAVSETYKPGKPAARITVCGAHATSMNKRRLAEYHSKWTRFTRERGVPTDFYCYQTMNMIEEEHGLKTFRIGAFDKSLPCLQYSYGGSVSLTWSTSIGFKERWADRFAEVKHHVPAPLVSGPRSLALSYSAQDHLPRSGHVISAEDQGYDRTFGRNTLFGTDNFSHASLFDPSVLADRRCNHALLQECFKEEMNMHLKVTSVVNPTSRTGQFEAMKTPQPIFAASAGHGLVQSGSALETLTCAHRYLGARPQPSYSAEGERKARELGRKNFETHYDVEKIVFDECLESLIEMNWASDATIRNYSKRLESEYGSGAAECQVLFSMKRQEKPTKTREIDPLKTGQGISAVSPAVNFEYGALFRKLNHRILHWAKDHVIYDCGTSERALKEELNEKRRGKVFDSVAVIDVVKCDMNQNWFTAAAEHEFLTLIANVRWLPSVDKYFRDVRGEYQIKTPSLFSGRVLGPKPSGAPDTLLGNTLAVEIYTTSTLDVRGPRLCVKKGDDRVEYGTSIKVNEFAVRELRHFTNFHSDVQFGSAMFTGKVITVNGMVDDVVKRTRKALMHPVSNYAQFCEFQKNLRQQFQEMVETGLDLVVGSAMEQYEITQGEAEGWLGLLYSLSHIGFEDWKGLVKDRSFGTTTVPTVRRDQVKDDQLYRRRTYDEYLAKELALRNGKKSRTLTRREQRQRLVLKRKNL